MEKPRIMVVDDSSTILNAAERFLRPDYDVILVDNGFKCLAAVHEARPDMLLLDVMMPRLDGLQVCRMIRDNPEFERLPIVFLSGKDSPFDKARGQLVGADEYLTKPFSKAALLEAVMRCLPPQETT